jgi:tetratricopeptide (TPR) repeat protein
MTTRIEKQSQAFRPSNYNVYAWKAVCNIVADVWMHYLRNKEWNANLSISCKEMYQMLLNDDGKLIIPKEKLRFSKNRFVDEWIVELENTVNQALVSQKTDVALFAVDMLQLIEPNRTMHLLNKAKLLHIQGHYSQSLLCLNKALALNPQSVECLQLRAETYHLLDYPDDALADISEAIYLAKENASLYAMRALLYAGAKKYTDAIIEVKTAIHINPTTLQHYLFLAEMQMESGNSGAANKTLQHILYMDISNAKAFYLMGIIQFDFLKEEKAGLSSLKTAYLLGYRKAKEAFSERLNSKNVIRKSA